MNGKFFLDTNVLLYEFDTQHPAKSRRAAELVRSAITTKRGVVSYQVVQEFFSVALTRFATPLPLNEAETYFSGILKPLLAIQSSPKLFLDGLRVHNQYRLSWYDSLIVAAAQQAECLILYTEDMQHGQRIGSLKIENPFR